MQQPELFVDSSKSVLGVSGLSCRNLQLCAQPGCQVVPSLRSWAAHMILPTFCTSARHVAQQVVGVEVQAPFRRLTYAEAMEKYASGEPF